MLYPVDQSKVLKNRLFRFFGATRYIKNNNHHYKKYSNAVDYEKYIFGNAVDINHIFNCFNTVSNVIILSPLVSTGLAQSPRLR